MKGSLLHRIKEKSKQEILCVLPRKIAHSYLYYEGHKEWPNFKNPQKYDEKIQWLIVNKYNESYGKYADKYTVREYVKECGLGDLLIPIYGVYNSAEEIDYANLPKEFVLMANHGSGDIYYEICRDKEKLDIQATNKKLNKALQTKFWKSCCEYHYKDIPPKIICMQFLKNPHEDRLTDYKVVCVNGKAMRILVCTNRDGGRDYYTREWKYLGIVAPEYRSGEIAERPKCLKQMLNAAEILAKPFPFARIDFYEVDGKLYFGEVTLTPASGCHKYLSEKDQLELGKEIKLGIEKSNIR